MFGRPPDAAAADGTPLLLLAASAGLLLAAALDASAHIMSQHTTDVEQGQHGEEDHSFLV
jgi:hypothetical protein